MEEKTSHGQPVKITEAELSEDTTYYTIKGKQNSFDEEGHPIQKEENHLTYAKKTGQRKLIKIDDRGEFMNPLGLYSQKVKLTRWAPVNDEAFGLYIRFLKTKNQLFIRQAERSVV